ncbi:17506_t:CDS:2 [Funneliformis geosporum]|uniref:Calcium-transporting ATPase n=1 Tax=Funneliformis geosporum TaxID=1117311 RepID=A0A9W4SAT7_9GLOM|nr:14027_t:CDS:2 [Funneliformis geosporum]CAI2163726.1 17506_t:CDS:2 [Funneliformis geosporum]
MSQSTTIQPLNQEENTPSNISNPFAFTPTQLYRLIDPKNLSLLKSYGGIDGLIKGLHSDPQAGLSRDESTPLKQISFKDITKDLPEDGSIIENEEDNAQQTLVVGQIPEEGAPFYQRIKAFGTNLLPEKKPKSIFQLMWIAMQEKVLILLTIAAFVSLGLGLFEDFGPHQNEEDPNQPKIRWVEGVAIIVAIIIVVMVGSLNDWQKEKQFQKLNAKKEDRNVKVIRNGRESLISVHDILVGDVLHLEPGDIIAADGVLIAGHNLRCDESAATGESDAVRKLKYEDCLKESEKEDGGVFSFHSKSDPFIISGSKVLEGVGIYIITGIGINSFHGKIMMSLRSDPVDTPLQVKLNDLAERIAKLGGAAALLMFLVLIIIYFVSFRNEVPGVFQVLDNLIRIVISTVTIIVVAVPEGLPLAVTLALAYATTRMLKDNNLVRVLSACETMGNATTICSDKTGTLTQNKMTVVAGTIGLSVSFVRDAEESKNNPLQNVDILNHPIPLQQLKSKLPEDIINFLNESIAINSSAFEGELENGKRTFVGSKTETALLGFLLDLDLDNIKSLRENAEIIQLFPFSSERKAMGVVIETGSKWRFYVKGASEVLLKRANMIVDFKADDKTAFEVINLTEERADKMQNIIETYARKSLRTIGLAYRDFEEWPPKNMTPNVEGDIPYEELVNGVTLLSIVGIEDPLREGVREAVQMCKKAGVTVRMVTGDNILTAKSIATQCEIFTGGEVMEGPVFRNLSPQEMKALLPKLQVLARSSPEDKKILVGRLKELGEVVAVTGDGTNDGPALKLSDVGFSMGIAGTEVAKEASSIILMDDNFSSIVKAIMWGRSVNDAVKKFLQFQLTVNVTAVLLTFITAVSSSDQRSVLSAVQLLWVNLIMDTFAALALATDPPTIDLLDRMPEPKNAPLITLDMWKMIMGQSIFQLVITLILFYGGEQIFEYEQLVMRTVIFNTFVFLQIFNEINCRRLDHKLNVLKGAWANKFLLVIFFIMVFGQVLIVEFGKAAFQATHLNIVQWLICIGFGSLSIPVGVIIRLIPTELIFCGFRTNIEPATTAQREKDFDAIIEMQNRLRIFKTLRGGRIRAHFGDKKEKRETRSKAFAAATMFASLVPASIGAPINYEQNNHTIIENVPSTSESQNGINPV